MAQLDTIRSTHRQKVADQLGPLLNELNGPRLGGPGAPMQLGISIGEVMMAPAFVMADSLEEGSETGLRPTGQTLSLIEVPDIHPTLGGALGGPRPSAGYVRHAASEDTDEADVTVNSISSSDLGQKLSDAYSWVDKNVEGDPLMRVITAPAYHMTALGVYDDGKRLSHIYVVTPPSSGAPVEGGTLYDIEEFRQRMREQPAAQGLEIPG